MNAKVVLIWAIMVVLLGVTAYSQPLPLCDVSSKISIGGNCTFLTPVINCSGANTYDVINLSGIEVVNDAALTELNESIFSFNFTLTQESNDFVIRLCEGSTREIQVIPGGTGGVTQRDLTNIAIAILLLGTVFILSKFAVELNEKHWTLKLGLFGVVIGMGWGLINIATKLAEDVGASSNVLTNLEGFFLAYTYISLLVFGYIMIRIIFWLITRIKKDNVELISEEDEEENLKGW